MRGSDFLSPTISIQKEEGDPYTLEERAVAEDLCIRVRHLRSTDGKIENDTPFQESKRRIKIKHWQYIIYEEYEATWQRHADNLVEVKHDMIIVIKQGSRFENMVNEILKLKGVVC
ncbi:MAG: hypothetical protein KJ886_02045 [Candidatus Thermoplasmatota archaeon]|nr:hypothetical protein [Candidatus Thermoplasmatota archaeon]MBU4256638.1 hypothetical protein [Candidatus Thermoplasmatota archaeon]MCG2826513.1 hypothetical protein [Thermoplasmatales archaeon]